MPRPTAFRGPTLCLFIGGVIALLAAPFLTWFDYPLNFSYPSQVSLVYLFENRFWIGPTLYLIGVAAALVTVLVAGRPVFFLGILPAAFPFFVLFLFALRPLVLGYQGEQPQALTAGVFTALLGSVLLELSYLSHRGRTAGAVLNTVTSIAVMVNPE